MTHKKAIKKLMSIGITRNNANEKLRRNTDYYTNAEIVNIHMSINNLIRQTIENPRNWCYLRNAKT
nr:MAG TPA: hypothetical protein [Caudoviricetes sp.]